MLKIYYYKTNTISDNTYNNIIEQLPYSMRKYIDSFKLYSDRRNRAVSRLMLLNFLASEHGCDINALPEFKNDKYGKPLNEGGIPSLFTIHYPLFTCSIYFNISHTAGITSIALSDSHVGIDIEKITEINPLDFRKFFTDNELEIICKSENKAIAFFKFWTLKESVMKLSGYGFSINPLSIEISMPESIFINGSKVFSKNYNMGEFILSVSAYNSISSDIYPEERIINAFKK